MTIGAAQGRARQDDTELGRHDVHDALFGRVHVEQLHATGERAGTSFNDQRLTPRHSRRIATARHRVHDVVHGAKRAQRIGQWPTGVVQLAQRDRAGTLVKQNSIDRQQGHVTAEIGDDMV